MLQHAIKNDAELQGLQDEILKRSSCIFQWVVFVLDRAIWQYREGYYISYILKKLYNTPADLDSLFKDILQGLNKNKQNQSRSLKLMKWIGFARRPLSLTELRFAMIVDSATSYPSFKQHQLSPLLWTADNGHRTVVKLLLEKSADVESKDSDNRTPLLWAVENGHKAVIELLLEGYEKALGPEHTSTLDTANNLASPYIGLGKMQEAEAMR